MANTEKADFGKRLIAYFIDYILIGLLMSVILLAFVVDYNQDFGAFITKFAVFIIAAFIVYGAKDFINGASVGKRIIGLGVKDAQGNVPPFYKLFLRNIFTMIWPLELIVLLVSKSHRKIGDMMMNTDVYVTSHKRKATTVIITVLLIFALGLLCFVSLIETAIKGDDSYKPPYNISARTARCGRPWAT